MSTRDEHAQTRGRELAEHANRNHAAYEKKDVSPWKCRGSCKVPQHNVGRIKHGPGEPQSARHGLAGVMNGSGGQFVEVATVMAKEVINTIRGRLKPMELLCFKFKMTCNCAGYVGGFCVGCECVVIFVMM